jgi:DNA-binding FrmR family transcriptional regulator
MANIQIHELNNHVGALGRDDYLPTDNGVNTTKIAFTDILGYVGSVISTPLVATTAEEMTDTEKIYVYVGTTTATLTNGHWYYYNGTAWADGGLYNAEAVVTDKTLSVSDAPADAKVVGDRLTEVEGDIDGIEGDIETINTTLESKADAEDVEADIEAINTALATKADAEEVDADIEAINTALETKADTDGNYDEMSVGNLLSSQFVEDKVPYLFRPTGGGIDIDESDRSYNDAIVGASVAWNQLVANSGSVSVTVPSGHKYYSNIGGTKVIAISNGSAISATGGTDNIVDLTALFGSAQIADYVYSLEQANAGAGVAWLKSHGFFTKDYYAYDSGSLKSVEGLVSHDTVGFNQWDEEWEVGMIDNSGANAETAVAIRSKNYIPVLSNTTYHFKFPVWCVYYFYDESKQFLQRVVNFGTNYDVEIPSNVHYVRFFTNTNSGITTYNHGICINLH